MRATKIEFQLRMVIMIVIVALGFWAPWIEAWGIGQRISLWEWLALWLSRASGISFGVAAPLVIVVAALFAAVGAILRIWGTAWLGYATVHHVKMQAGEVLTDGPYRYVRNPLYLGGWFMMAATSFILPPSGAIFSMTLLTVFFIRLILGEEAFLAGQLGEPYQIYLRSVPRLLPRLRATIAPSSRKPAWVYAVLTEVNPIGIFVTLAFLSWSYNNWLMIKAIIVSLGVSLVVRALMPGIRHEPERAG